MTKQDQNNAEKAAQHYLASLGYTIQRKAIRTMYQKVDFFCADVMAKNAYGEIVYAQVTTGGYEAVRQRKRKLEKIPWNEFETVLILAMERRKEGRAYIYWFVKHIYLKLTDGWLDGILIPIPREWFKKYEG
jgi:hypothetical protein